MKTEKSNPVRHKGLLLIVIGLLLIVAAFSLIFYNLSEDVRAGKASGQTVKQLEESMPTPSAPVSADSPAPAPVISDSNAQVSPSPVEIEPALIPDYVLCPNMEMPTARINETYYIGVLRIPALGLELPVISAWNYANLKIAPCRFSGSVYQNDLIICGHNYSSHFGTLKNLREDDSVTFTDMDGNVFNYRLVEREILQPTQMEALEHGDWDLTLFTCTVGGRSRITLRFELLPAD
ncbi:MAG: sortase [Oscillospiraceae bacterium]|nr:sortase [Oscillospiraceae bacterium]